MTQVRAIIGPPGTGKTTRVAADVRRAVGAASPATPYARRDRAPALVCSFTRAAAREAAGRDTGLDRRQIGTLHSFAFRALDRPELTEGKEDDFNKWLGAKEPHFGITETSSDDPLGKKRGGLGDLIAAEYHRLRCIMVPRDEWGDHLYDRRSFTLQTLYEWVKLWEEWKESTGLLDFTDLLEIAVRDVMVAPGDPEMIWMDEAQDTSKLALELAKRWAARCESLTIVGDPWQALYAPWAGAHPEMFASEKIHETEVLDQSYRVPRLAHKRAMQWVRQLSDYREISYRPRDDDGEVIELGATWKTPRRILDEIDRAEGTCMIQGTCEYHLNPVIKLLRAAGIPFANPWRENNGKWNPLKSRSPKSLTNRMRALMRIDGTWTYEDLYLWSDALLVGSIMHRGAKGDIKARANAEPQGFVVPDDIRRWFNDAWITDLLTHLANGKAHHALAQWARHLPARNQNHAAYCLRVMRAGKFDEKPRVFVGTIHSFKGSEADNVFVFPDLSPTAARGMGRVENRDAIVRAGYVAMTRTRQRLFLCEPKSWDWMRL